MYVNRNDLDFSVQKSYDLYIQAQDDGSPAAADYGWVHINVTNVNDAPYFTATNQTFKFKEVGWQRGRVLEVQRFTDGDVSFTPAAPPQTLPKPFCFSEHAE